MQQKPKVVDVKVGHTKETRFRGGWSPSVRDPSQFAFKFLPTAPAQKPRVAKAAPPPEPEPIKALQVLSDAPPEATARGALNILDRYRNYRGYISAEGTCYNNVGQIIGYIDAGSGQVGSSDQEYLGWIRQDNVIEDAVEAKLGEIDLGRAYIKNTNGSTIAELDNTGSVTGHAGTFLGQFEGFTYHQMKVIGLYLFLVDPGMLNEVEG